MIITEIQLIVDTLNKKKYAQRNELSGVDRMDLTEGEKNIIQAYRPEQSLVIYGTLAPGRPNHPVVKPIKGVWQQGTVSGKLANRGWGARLGYYGFVPTQSSERVEIPVYILFSTELMRHWPMLDTFEGPGYQRILVPFVLENGSIGIGNIYALQEDSLE